MRPLVIEERRVGGSGGCSLEGEPLVGDPLVRVVGGSGAEACSVGPLPTSTVSGAPGEDACKPLGQMIISELTVTVLQSTSKT